MKRLFVANVFTFAVCFSGLLAAQDVPGDYVNDSSGTTMPRAVVGVPVVTDNNWATDGISMSTSELIDNPLLQQANIACGFVIEGNGGSNAQVLSNWELQPADDGYCGQGILKSHVMFIRESTHGTLTWNANSADVGGFNIADWGFFTWVSYEGSVVFTDFLGGPYGTVTYYTEEGQDCLYGSKAFNVVFGDNVGQGISSMTYHIDTEAEAPIPGSEIRARLYTTGGGLVWEEVSWGGGGYY